MDASLSLDPDSLWAFAYVSTPAVPFSDRDLSDLMIAARASNAADGLSGKLVVLEEGDRVLRFAQWIEGPRWGLAGAIARILRDTRHGDFEVRHLGAVAERRFPGWDMALYPADSIRFPTAAARVTA